MSKEKTPITADYIKKEILKGLSEVFRGKTIYMKDIEVSIEEYAQAKVLEALDEVDKYCDGKISHFSKAPMDLQGILATREVKTYLNILRNISKTKV